MDKTAQQRSCWGGRTHLVQPPVLSTSSEATRTKGPATWAALWMRRDRRIFCGAFAETIRRGDMATRVRSLTAAGSGIGAVCWLQSWAAESDQTLFAAACSLACLPTRLALS